MRDVDQPHLNAEPAQWLAATGLAGADWVCAGAQWLSSVWRGQPTNVLLYAALFSAGDALQQRLRGGPADWRQTRRVATVAVTFHGNFNYVWLRLLERALPGRAPRAVLAKVLCDQAFGGPVALAAFYAGMSLLQGEDDIFLDLKQKFWNTYKTGLIYWPFVQLINFSLVPVHWRTAYTGLCGFLWATFLCFSKQSGDGTLKSVFTFLHVKEANAVERPPEK
ncbi:PREDICTED: mpv17-like protein [Ceratotherium simum simum]|uniref:Mpv17-like protein n=1 Tax=Ceratotherium simum simum TaxID=73337 RepID=A0ABM0I7A8_CERSS|nr:PREDICTED: mpv17-like protein [Ceratotherium simum simum]